MITIIKEAKPMGNSANVYVPKEWVGRRVVVRLLSPKELILDTLEPHMENIIGAYLYGSYARGEEQLDSDIDILVVTDRKIRLDYTEPLDIVVVTEEELKTILREDPVQLAPIIRESRPIVNESYLREIKSLKINPDKYLKLTKETKNKLKVYEQMIADERHLPSIIYSLVLRLTAIHLVDLMLSGKEYRKAEFNRYITSSGISEEAYESLHQIYRRVRDNKKLPKGAVTLDEIMQLHKIVGEENKKLEERIREK